MELNKHNLFNDSEETEVPEAESQDTSQTEEKQFQEYCEILLPNGSKIVLGSSSRPIEVLCELALRIKAELENGNSKSKREGGRYIG
jgi:hypothetical protein